MDYLSVRQLLIAGWCAAGLLLVDLPAPAQLSNDTSTFNGEVAATCSFSLPDSIQLEFRSLRKDLYGSHDFELTTNSSAIRVSVAQLTVDDEPSPVESAVVPQITLFYVSGSTIYMANGTKVSGETLGPSILSASGPNQLNLSASVGTATMRDNQYLLPPGNYSYSTTISCLL